MDAPADAAYGGGMALAHPVPARVPSGRLVLRSRADVWRYGCGTAVAIALAPVAVPLAIVLAPAIGGPFLQGLIYIIVLCIIVMIVAKGFTVIGTRAIVDARGLELRRSGQFSRFIPWEEAHGRITVKTVTEYAPGGSATMGMVVVGLDHEQVVLPGTLMSVHGQNAVEREVRGIAAQILSFDSWGQTSPLVDQDQSFHPLGRPPQL